MSDKIPSSHALARLFRWATKRAFRCYPELYDEAVSDHICNHILTDFVRADSLYLLKDEAGCGIGEIPDMLIKGDARLGANSLARELVTQVHIGDFSLFMAGLFPDASPRKDTCLKSKRTKDRIFMELYLSLHPSQRGLDFYIVNGKKAYEKAAKIYKGLNEIKFALLKRLSQHFDSYVSLMHTINDFIISPGLNMG